MQKLIPKYGVAAHLALLAVSPLFLFPYCGEGWIASTMMCLAAFSAIWMVMEPSRRSGEFLHESRDRVCRGMLLDPLFWMMATVVLLAGLRWANGGVGMGYDAELRKWFLKSPSCAIMPGTVDGRGALPFAGSLSALVIAMAFRHALGKSARLSFLLVSSFLAAVAAVAAAVMAHLGLPAAVAAASAKGLGASAAGTAFALYFLGGVIALGGMFEAGWSKSLLLYSLALGGTFTGAFIFLPPQLAALHAIGGILAIVVVLVYVGVTRSAPDSLKCAVAVLIAALLPVLLTLALAPGAAAFDRFCAMFGGDSLFPESFMRTRAVLSSIAFGEWRVHPWLGTGIGSFPLDIRFRATENDWALVEIAQTLPRSGWWALLAERGMTGALAFAIPLGFMAFTFFRRLVGAFGGGRSFIPGCCLGVVAVALLVAQSFVDASILFPETLMAATAFVALSAASFPPLRKKENDDSPNGDKEKED